MTCECGHDIDDHNYTPSGCGSTRCLFDSDGEVAISRSCDCIEYYPTEESVA